MNLRHRISAWRYVLVQELSIINAALVGASKESDSQIEAVDRSGRQE